jgi:ADP-ribose pyrophosphatase
MDSAMDKHLEESCIDSEQVYDGRLLKVWRDRVRLPDNSEAAREYIKHPGAVAILGILPDGRILLERQYRYPMQRVMLEFPAGKLEYGEDPLECAKRELLEETGYTANQWQHITTIHNAIAYSDERIELYLARGLTEGQAQLDHGEFLETITASLDELLDWVRTGKITDVKTVIGTFWLQKLLAADWT